MRPFTQKAALFMPLACLYLSLPCACHRIPERSRGRDPVRLMEQPTWVPLDGYRLRAHITRPAKQGHLMPAVLLIQGYDCDSIALQGEGEQNHPYRRLATGLARSGMVVMRVEKSGVGGSGGAICAKVDYTTDLKGFTAALITLRTTRGVNRAKLFLFGHSIGAGMAARIASTQQVAGVMVYGAGFKPWLTYERENYARQLSLRRLTSTKRATLMRNHERVMELFYTQKLPMSAICVRHPHLTMHCDSRFYLMERAASFFHQLAASDPALYWRRVKAPVLAMWGSADITTTAGEHRAIVRAVPPPHRVRSWYRAFPDTNHSMERLDPKTRTHRFDTTILSTIRRWHHTL